MESWLVVRMNGWLVGWLVCLFERMDGWLLVGWLVRRIEGWLAG